MADASTPPPIELARDDGLEKFMLRGKRQIAQLLQELIDNRCLISAHSGGGHSFMTAVLRIDEDRERVVLDASPDADANRRALAAERVQCVTLLDHIRIQFSLTGLSSGQEKSHPALSAPIPKEMLRLQRREFFRLKVPLAHELTCVLAAEDLARKPVQAQARVEAAQIYAHQVQTQMRQWRSRLKTLLGMDVPERVAPLPTERLEAAMHLYGADMDATTSPLEVGLGWLVHLEMPAAFVGREALERQSAEGVRRKRVGLKLQGRAIARHGYPVLHDGAVVGEITSGSWSPTLAEAIALAYVPAELAKLGTELAVEIRGKAEPARVVKRPFYRRG